MIQAACALSSQELATFQERFLAEARTAARLSHPGIVVVHDVGQDAGTGELYIAMEHLEGRTLAEALRPGVALPWREALRLTGRIAEALHYAHARAVVHRDVKPANVMLLDSGEPKLMDFGIAKTDSVRVKLTAAGQSIGTPLYASPEQLLGRPADGRSDVFSLGAIAYLLLTGYDAFSAQNLAGVVTRVVGSDPVPPSSLVSELPPDVDRVVARALAKDPSQRYQAAAAFADDLAGLLAGAPSRRLPAPSPLGSETLPLPRRASAPLDVEAELAALVEAPIEERPATVSAPAPKPAPLRRIASWLALAVAAAGAAGALVAARSPALPGPQASPPAQAAPATESAGVPLREPGRLSIGLQGLPRDASVHVWVDRAPVAGTRWADPSDDATRSLLFGSNGTSALALAPGGHDVEVEVGWDGKRYGARIWGDIKPDSTRRLRGKVAGLLRKRLALEWD
jgi:serine/threonine-protein kinase